jgi:hypothetical protein
MPEAGRGSREPSEPQGSSDKGSAEANTQIEAAKAGRRLTWQGLAFSQNVGCAGRAIRIPIEELERFENESAPPPSG